MFAAAAPKAIGPYSQAIRSGNLFFCLGHTPLEPLWHANRSFDIEAQTLRTIQNLESILASVGLNLSNIAKPMYT
jgi:2-iminobutanoate/2-iminopropanoate deaminase